MITTGCPVQTNSNVKPSSPWLGRQMQSTPRLTSVRPVAGLFLAMNRTIFAAQSLGPKWKGEWECQCGRESLDVAIQALKVALAHPTVQWGLTEAQP